MKRNNILLSVALALAACTDTNDPAANIPPGGLDPNTPVAITMETSPSVREVTTRTANLPLGGSAPKGREVKAEGEFTATTPISPNGTSDATITAFLPAATDRAHMALSYSGTIATGNWQYYSNAAAGYTDLPALHLKDFAPSKTKTAVAFGGTSKDIVWASTTRTDEAGKASTYAFKLRHATAKVTLFLQDKDGNPIDPAIVTAVTHTAPTGSYEWYDGTTSIGASPLAWMWKDENKDKVPTFAFTPDGTTKTFTLTPLRRRQGGDNLWNGITNPIASVNTDHKLTVNIAEGTGNNPLPAGPYSIALSSIMVNGNALVSLAANRHLTVTLTLDRLEGLSATASISDWTVSNASAEAGDEDTSGAIVP